MNFQPALSLLAKDLKRLVWFAAPVSIAAFGDRFMVFSSSLEGGSAQLAALIQWPLIFFVALAAGAEDRAVGDRTFWRTRPVSPIQVAVAKLLALSILLVLPIALLELIRALQHDIRPVVAVAMMVERTGTVALVALSGLLLGALTDSLLRAMAVIVVSFAVVMLAAIAGFNSWMQAMMVGIHLPDVSTASRITVRFTLLVGSLLYLISIAYRYNSARLTTIGTVIAVIASTTIANAWKWQIVAEPSSLDQPAAYEGEIDLSVHHFRDLQVMGMSGRGDSQIETGLSIYYDWNTPDLTINRIRKESQITLPDGSLLRSETERYSNLTYTAFNQMIRHQFGLPRRHNLSFSQFKKMSEGQRIRPEHLFTLPTNTLQTFQQQSASVETRLVLSLAEPKILSTMAVKSGERRSLDGEVFQTRDPKFLEDGALEIPVLNSRATSMLYPQGIHRPDHRITGRQYGFALVNRNLNEVSISTQYGRIFILLQGAFPTRIINPRFRSVESLKSSSDDSEPSQLDQTWLDGAELMIVVAQPIGEASQTVTFENLKLPSLELRPEADPTVFIN